MPKLDTLVTDDIEQQVPLIYAVVATKWKRIPYGLHFRDLVTAGYFGLNNARRTFDPSRGWAFKSWAWQAINCYINNEVTRWKLQCKIYYLPLDDEDDPSKFDLYRDRKRPRPEEEVERRDLLEFWFSRLTEGQEAVMWLEYYAGLRRKEVAVAFDVCCNSIRGRELRALRRLASVVDESLVYE